MRMLYRSEHNVDDLIYIIHIYIIYIYYFISYKNQLNYLIKLSNIDGSSILTLDTTNLNTIRMNFKMNTIHNTCFSKSLKNSKNVILV